MKMKNYNLYRRIRRKNKEQNIFFRGVKPCKSTVYLEEQTIKPNGGILPVEKKEILELEIDLTKTKGLEIKASDYTYMSLSFGAARKSDIIIINSKKTKEALQKRYDEEKAKYGTNEEDFNQQIGGYLQAHINGIDSDTLVTNGVMKINFDELNTEYLKLIKSYSERKNQPAELDVIIGHAMSEHPTFNIEYIKSLEV